MEFLRDPNIDFMGSRRYLVPVSVLLVLLSIGTVFVRGQLNLGIDFAGGTQLTLKFSETPSVDDLRSAIESAGIDDALIQRFGDEEDNEVIIKTPIIAGSEEGSRDLVVSTLNELFGAEATALDLNQRGSASIADLLLRQDPDQLRAADEAAARAHYDGVAQAIIGQRQETGLISSWEQLREVGGVSDEAAAALEADTVLGEFAVIGLENVGPQIGSELRRKGILAVLSSLLGILGYIWFRFELRYGIGALVAVTHDVLIVLGFYALAGYEFNLTTIAAFLTLVGYSVNDSVVVFDRVRENLRRNRTASLEQTMNRSINQTLSRTILTSSTTLMVVGCLLVAGGDVLRGFAFILTLGVVVGTYSSIYVASPFALLWERVFGRAARSRRRSKAA